MNQPTREEFERLEQEQMRLNEKQRNLEEEVRKLKEQQTEPIKITRLEIDSGSMHNRLDMVQEDMRVLKDDVGVLKIEIQGTRADILRIREPQADLRDRLIEHSGDLKAIKDKQDAHSEILDRLVDFAESHEKNMGAMATKDDLGRLGATMASKDDITQLNKIMLQILERLPKQPE